VSVMVAKTQAELIAMAIYEALDREEDALVMGSPDLRRTTIDGHFDLISVAEFVLTSIAALKEPIGQVGEEG
jgi:hypothetical protein